MMWRKIIIEWISLPALAAGDPSATVVNRCGVPSGSALFKVKPMPPGPGGIEITVVFVACNPGPGRVGVTSFS